MDNPSFFYLLVSVGLGGGPVFERTYHRGATCRSGEIGLMPDVCSSVPGARVQDTVSLSALLARFAAAGEPIPTLDQLTEESPIVSQWIEDAVRALTMPVISINCLIDPDAILIGGRLPGPLIERLASGLETALASVEIPSHAKVLPATMAQDAPAIGAAILPFLDHLLPSDAILMQVGRS